VASTPVRIEEEVLAEVDAWAMERGCTRTHLVAHALDKVLAAHGRLDPADRVLTHDERRELVAKRRVARGDV
jgi:hypothetical protein